MNKKACIAMLMAVVMISTTIFVAFPAIKAIGAPVLLTRLTVKDDGKNVISMETKIDGEQLFTLAYSLSGTGDDLTDISFKVTIPKTLELVEVIGGSSVASQDNGATITYTLKPADSTLSPGTTQNMKFRTKYSTSGKGYMPDGTVSTVEAEFNSNEENQEINTVKLTVTGTTNPSIDKRLTEDIIMGEEVTYIITLNPGTLHGTDFIITDTLPTITGVTISDIVTNPPATNITGNNIIWNLGSRVITTPETFTIKLKYNGDYSGMINNVVSADFKYAYDNTKLGSLDASCSTWVDRTSPNPGDMGVYKRYWVSGNTYWMSNVSVFPGAEFNALIGHENLNITNLDTVIMEDSGFNPDYLKVTKIDKWDEGSEIYIKTNLTESLPDPWRPANLNNDPAAPPHDLELNQMLLDPSVEKITGMKFVKFDASDGIIGIPSFDLKVLPEASGKEVLNYVKSTFKYNDSSVIEVYGYATVNVYDITKTQEDFLVAPSADDRYSTVTSTYQLGKSSTYLTEANNISIYNILPEGVSYVNNSTVKKGNAAGAVVPANPVITPNFDGTGRTLLKWDISGTVNTNQRLKLEYKVDADSSTIYTYMPNYSYVNAAIGDDSWYFGAMYLPAERFVFYVDGYLYSDTDPQYIRGRSTQPDIYDINGNGDYDELVMYSKCEIMVSKDDLSALQKLTSKLTINGEDRMLDVVEGEVLEYKLNITNRSGIAMEDIRILDILPHIDDKEVVSGANRNSGFSNTLLGPISINGVSKDQIEILYSTQGNPQRDDINLTGVGTEEANWMMADEVTDFTEIKSILIKTKNGYQMPANGSFDLTWSVEVPYGLLSEEISYNSFGYTAKVLGDDFMLPAEPKRVGMIVEKTANINKVSGYVWDDADQDGLRSAGELGINGLVIEVYDYDTNKLIKSGRSTNDASGNAGYYAVALEPGEYYIKTNALAAGYDYTTHIPGAPKNSKIIVASGKTDKLVMWFSDADDIDIGLKAKGKIAGEVWNDVDRDGEKDSGEDPFVGVKIELFDEHGIKIDETVSESDGTYKFEKLHSGRVYIKVGEGRYSYSPKGTDSHINPSGESDMIEIVGNTVTVNAGIMPALITVREVKTDSAGTIELSVLGTRTESVNPAGSEITITASDRSGLTLLDTKTITQIFYKDTIVTFRYKEDSKGSSGGSGGGGGGSSKPVDIPDNPPAQAKPELEKDNHIQYLYGYPGNTVRPDRNITRAEAAVIFYRLIKAADKEGFVVGDIPYKDLTKNRWFIKEVMFLTEHEIMNGYKDGTFRPDEAIKRAEFAALASRFDELEATEENVFRDVTEKHWAKSYINSAYKKGWVNGYNDGTFKPDDNIKRSEVVTIVNKMLNRKILLEDIPTDFAEYSDVADRKHWAYADLMEATIIHEYTRDEGETEKWTEYRRPDISEE